MSTKSDLLAEIKEHLDSIKKNEELPIADKVSLEHALIRLLHLKIIDDEEEEPIHITKIKKTYKGSKITISQYDDENYDEGDTNEEFNKSGYHMLSIDKKYLEKVYFTPKLNKSFQIFNYKDKECNDSYFYVLIDEIFIIDIDIESHDFDVYKEDYPNRPCHKDWFLIDIRILEDTPDVFICKICNREGFYWTKDFIMTKKYEESDFFIFSRALSPEISKEEFSNIDKVLKLDTEV